MKQIVELSNGLRVGNFGSPHKFLFDDHTILPAASLEDCKKIIVSKSYHMLAENNQYGLCTIEVSFYKDTIDHVNDWKELIDSGYVDLVIVPRIVRDCFNSIEKSADYSEFVCSVLVDNPEGRVNKIMRSDLFCL